ncbi:hypothetical protein ZIOFF_044115 [Zingiber officinale]|uniref:Reverse transcriptase Ty1/copia-type domain-containing protein n=1 Tax=Zingiber officinale TaxID=94328 RepID=A0A8J5L023_ZINOF|nr:hypothetical protein ZIOFF_044115 [Zingiber officinale]
MQCPYEHALYVRADNDNILLVSLYVDDLIVTGSSPQMIKSFKEVMAKAFDMTDMGLMSYFLGLEVKQGVDGIFMTQEQYANEVLKRFRMDDCNPINTLVDYGTKLSKNEEGKTVDPTRFKSLVGSLWYLTCTRPDILYRVGLVSRFIEEPKETHWKAAKRILRYVRGAMNHGLFYSHSNNSQLIGYSDSDCGGDCDDQRSTSGFAFFVRDTAFSWMSKKQPIVTLSTCETEYIAASSCVSHAIWLRSLLKEIKFEQSEATQICIDNKSTIALGKNPSATTHCHTLSPLPQAVVTPFRTPRAATRSYLC